MLAAWGGYNISLSLLLEAGADPNATDPDGWTPLVFGAYECSPDVVNLLIEAGAATDVTNRHGDTALSLAHYRGCDKVVRLLTSNQ